MLRSIWAPIEKTSELYSLVKDNVGSEVNGLDQSIVRWPMTLMSKLFQHHELQNIPFFASDGSAEPAQFFIPSRARYVRMA